MPLALSGAAWPVGRCAGPEGEGGCFESPSLPPLDSLPSRNDQRRPLDSQEEVAADKGLKNATLCLAHWNHQHTKTAADAFFLTVFDRRSDCRKAPAVRWRVTSNVWAGCCIAFTPHGGCLCENFAVLPGGTFEPTHPPTEVTPGLRPRPLTGALNLKQS